LAWIRGDWRSCLALNRHFIVIYIHFYYTTPCVLLYWI
jgi:hypothetical protein